MVLANQKPKQSNRQGEVAEGLPGSDKRGMREEKQQRTWETQKVPAQAGRRSRPKEGEPRAIWESDQSIDTQRRESRSQGEGLTWIGSQQRKH